jgi:hypothetical protein
MLEATQNAGNEWLLKEPKLIFFFFTKLYPGAFTYSQEAYIIFIIFARLSTCNSVVPTGRILVKFDVGDFLKVY